MHIERLSSTDGLPIDLKRTVESELLGIVDQHQDSFVALEPREYDITPRRFTNNLYTHNLIVHPDGRGTYRTLPKDDDVGMIDVIGKEMSERCGGCVVRIPEDKGIVVIAGPTSDDPQLRIFEVIVCFP